MKKNKFINYIAVIILLITITATGLIVSINYDFFRSGALNIWNSIVEFFNPTEPGPDGPENPDGPEEPTDPEQPELPALPEGYYWGEDTPVKDLPGSAIDIYNYLFNSYSVEDDIVTGADPVMSTADLVENKLYYLSMNDETIIARIYITSFTVDFKNLILTGTLNELLITEEPEETVTLHFYDYYLDELYTYEIIKDEETFNYNSKEELQSPYDYIINGQYGRSWVYTDSNFTIPESFNYQDGTVWLRNDLTSAIDAYFIAVYEFDINIEVINYNNSQASSSKIRITKENNVVTYNNFTINAAQILNNNYSRISYGLSYDTSETFLTDDVIIADDFTFQNFYIKRPEPALPYNMAWSEGIETYYTDFNMYNIYTSYIVTVNLEVRSSGGIVSVNNLVVGQIYYVTAGTADIHLKFYLEEIFVDNDETQYNVIVYYLEQI